MGRSIAIVGAGAVGGYYGARLAQAGHEVHFLLRSDLEAVRRDGLTIRSCVGNFVLPPATIRAYGDPREMPRVDLVIVALKTTANDQFLPLVAPLLGLRTLILTVQNGLGNEERLGELFGAERILGGLAFVCINRIAPGVIEHTDYGLIKLGEFGGPPQPRTRELAAMFESARVPCRLLDDLRAGRWEKLIWNVPFNGLSAALDMTTDRIIASAAGEALVRTIMTEVIAGAAGVGVRLPPELIDDRINLTRTMGPYRTSMHLDRLHGRPMELEAIFAQPLRMAAKAGVEMPATEHLHKILQIANLGKSLKHI